MNRKNANALYKPTSLCFGHIADGMPPFRYHVETKRCYMVGEKGPCPDLMRFAMIDADYGTCDCDPNERCGRPLIYWKPTKRCYRAFDRGPCAPGKWLVFGFNLTPVCKTNRCAKEAAEDPSKGRKFWFTHQGKCYKTYTQGYCKEGQVLFNNMMEYRPTCNNETLCEKRPTLNLMSCLPGSIKDYEGKCNRRYEYKS